MIEIDEKAQKIFDAMIELGHIPEKDLFEITDELKNISFELYRKVFPPKTGKPLSKSEISYCKKLAGFNMMRLNEKRFLENSEPQIMNNIPKFKSECGFVYIISNESFPGMYKVGITRDMNARLNTYQTCDPFRRFKIEHYRFVQNRRKIEKSILDRFKIDVVKGEWISNENVKKVLTSME